MTDWTEVLAEAIREDRVDRGVDREGARRRALRYRQWLETLPERHDRETCEDEEFIRRWPGDLGFHTGQATVFVARQGAGKTNTLSYLVQKAIEHRPEWDVYTNIPFPWDGPLRAVVPAPPRLYTVRSMSGLLRGVAETIRADRIPAVAIDEMDQATTSHEWASERSESWTKFLYVERHFRVRGPLLAYHVYEHVPLPLRRIGDLRGSYFRVVVRGGERRLARVEDTSAWWVVRESVLPYQTLGLRGFALDVDMRDLEERLDGDRLEVARQVLAYLDEGERQRHEEAAADAAGTRAALAAAVVRRDAGIAERHVAQAERLEAIVRAFMEDPGLTIRSAAERFHSSHSTLIELKSTALKRLRESGATVTPALHVTGYEA